MFKVKWAFKIGKHMIVGGTFDTEALAWRFIHEILEEGFGDNYGEAELAEYSVVPA